VLLLIFADKGGPRHDSDSGSRENGQQYVTDMKNRFDPNGIPVFNTLPNSSFSSWLSAASSLSDLSHNYTLENPHVSNVRDGGVVLVQKAPYLSVSLWEQTFLVTRSDREMEEWC
jgi:hypothetical protein